MPRRSPLTQADIDARCRSRFPRALGQVGARPHARLGVVPSVEATSPDNTHNTRSFCGCDFTDALDILGVPSNARAQCAHELEVIRTLYADVKIADAEDAPARKMETFHKASRWYQRRLASVDSPPRNSPRMPQALELEAVRLQSPGFSSEKFLNACKDLKDRYKRQSRAGRKKSYALRQTIHRLQTFAAEKNEKLVWDNRNIPIKLIQFVIAFLDAAGIRRYPSFENNPSRFRRLLLRPAPKRKARSQCPDISEETE